MSNVLNFSIRGDCRTCALFLPGSHRCRVIEIHTVSSRRGPEWTSTITGETYNGGARTWFDVIIASTTERQRDSLLHSCGQRDAAARSYLAGEDQQCGAHRPKNAPQIRQTEDYDFGLDAPLSEQELV